LRQETARGPKNRKTMDLLAEGGQKGRPAKGRTFAEVLRAVGEEKGMMEAVARRVWAMARGGNMTAVGFIADRLDGKVEARVKVEDKHNFTADFDLLRKALTSGVEGEEP